MSDYYIDYYEPTPSAQPFRDSLITALCAAVNMQDGPEREYTRTTPTNDAPLGRDGVMPQSGVRGVYWSWANRKRTIGRWAVNNTESKGKMYFPGTLAGLEQAKAHKERRTMRRMPILDSVVPVLSVTEWKTAHRITEAIEGAQYSTVTAVLKRLHDAGQVERRKRDKVYEYRRLH